MFTCLHKFVALTTTDTAADAKATPYTAFVTPTTGTFTFYVDGSASAVVPLIAGVVHKIRYHAVKTTGSSVTVGLIGGWLNSADIPA